LKEAIFMALRDELKADSKQRSNNIEEASKVEVAYDEYGEVDAEKTQKNIRKSVRKAAEIRNEGKV
jgi:hypothetical protein